MKKLNKLAVILLLLLLSSCNGKLYETNRETLYRTGKNKAGEIMIDRKASRIPLVRSCVTCHGKDGDRMKNVSIRFTNLSNPEYRSIPYTDSLFYRFLDHDLKSDDTKANIGVIWKMSDKDKRDLLAYLKRL